MIRAGVLCLQGSSEPHLQRLQELGVEARRVRQVQHLQTLTHLIIPGGESTTINHLLRLFGLYRELRERALGGTLALFGTCAGAILLGRDDGTRPPRLNLLDATLTRNAYGRQIDSFRDAIELTEMGGGTFPGIFIRAPRFASVGPGSRVLGRHRGQPVLVEGPGVLAATFHPELTTDLSIHRYFLAKSPEPLPLVCAG